MKFVVGLGNPGFQYIATKHNIGAAVVKGLAKENGIKINQKVYSSVLGRGRISGEEAVLVLPQTYMNLSGKTVGELFRQEVKDIGDLLVVCDDINLELGRIRLRKKGSSGGHKGLESIIHTLARDDFARLRVGIATDVHPALGLKGRPHKGDITNYVLTPFKRKDRRNVLHIISLAQEAAELFIEKGIDEAMGKFNKRKAGTS